MSDYLEELTDVVLRASISDGGTASPLLREEAQNLTQAIASHLGLETFGGVEAYTRNQQANRMAQAVHGVCGYMPWEVRYRAARAALKVVRQWRSENPNIEGA